jgi:hydroxypyruvate isomerase
VLRFAANISLLFTEWPLLDRFAAARDAGFEAIEVQFPYDETPQALARSARAAGVSVALINAPVGPDLATLGLACVDVEDGLFLSEMARGLRYALALGAPCVNVLAGRTSAAGKPASLERLVRRLAIAAEAFAGSGIVALLEPMNPLDRPDYCVTDFDTASAVLRRTDPRVGLQFDCYHAARMGLDPVEAWTRLCGDIRHVQIADCPGRHEPGSGSLDWTSLFGALQSAGYAGWVGAEYLPSAATPQSLGWFDRWRPVRDASDGGR